MTPCQKNPASLLLGTRRLNLGGSVPLLPPLPHSNRASSSLAPCHYEGKHFSLGESWLRKDCFHCTCLHPVGVGCCDT